MFDGRGYPVCTCTTMMEQGHILISHDIDMRGNAEARNGTAYVVSRSRTASSLYLYRLTSCFLYNLSKRTGRVVGRSRRPTTDRFIDRPDFEYRCEIYILCVIQSWVACVAYSILFTYLTCS